MMKYNGKYNIFDSSAIKTYPVAERSNKVKLADLVDPSEILKEKYELGEMESDISELAEKIVHASKSGRPVIWLTGAHLIKNGLGPIVNDLVQRKIITLVATNGAGTIHDFELAMIGETSEHVPNALPEGTFGMASELGYINAILTEGNIRNLGYGESLGRCMRDDEFRRQIEKRVGRQMDFRHSEISVIANCYDNDVPLTVHVGIGTDVIDQHANFDGEAKGGCSGRDFLIYTNEVMKLRDGGVVLNIGSAVTGPEVLLKAVSMVGNVGNPPFGLIAADFDLKPYHRKSMTDEGSFEYYYRHHKSVVTRVPEAFGGKGFYIQGNQKLTIPRLYQEICRYAGQ